MDRELMDHGPMNYGLLKNGGAKPGLTLAFVCLETIWLVAWLLIIETLLPVPPRASLALVGLYYPLARLLGPAAPTGWLPGSQPKPGKIRFLALWLLTLVAVAAGLLLLNPFESWRGLVGSWPGRKLGLVILVAGSFALRRGLWLAGRVVDRRGLIAALQLGLILIVLANLAGLAVEITLPALLPLTMLFILTGLSGLVLARTEKPDSSQGRGRGPGLSLPVVVFLSLIIAALWLALDKQAVELLLKPLVWLWNLISALLHWLASLLAGKPEPLPPDPLALPAPPPDRPLAEHFKFLEKIKPLAEAVFIFSILALVIGALKASIEDLLAWLRRRYTTSPGARLSRSRAGFFSDLKALWSLLAALFRSLAARLRGRRPAAGPVYARAASVRQSYRRLLAWSAARQRGKAPDETPAEFAARLRAGLIQGPGKRVVKKFNLADRAALDLTGLYERARYGPSDLSREDVDQARRSLRLIKKGRFKPPGPEPDRPQDMTGRLDKWQPFSSKKDEKSDQHDRQL